MEKKKGEETEPAFYIGKFQCKNRIILLISIWKSIKQYQLKHYSHVIIPLLFKSNKFWTSCHFLSWLKCPTDLSIIAAAHTFDNKSSTLTLMRNPKGKLGGFSPLEFVVNIRPWNLKYRGSITKKHRLWSSDRK